MVKKLEQYYDLPMRKLKKNFIVKHNDIRGVDKEGRFTRRQRKNESQVMVLELEYQKGLGKLEASCDKKVLWARKDIRRLSKKVGLSQAQVYKWQWDRCNKTSS